MPDHKWNKLREMSPKTVNLVYTKEVKEYEERGIKKMRERIKEDE